MKPFRFWVQTALPLVYDDSLSYYELLCKVVSYINATISDVSSLSQSFTELKSYVDNYFDNNLKDELNEKLDQMAEDGTLAEIMDEYYGNLKGRVDTLDLRTTEMGQDIFRMQQQIARLGAVPKNLLILGDSYGTGGGGGISTTPWPVLVGEALHDNYNAVYRNFSRSAAGFGRGGGTYETDPETGLNFCDVLNYAANSMSINERGLVDTIVVGGGVNDTGDNVQTYIAGGMRRFAEIVADKFPNARVYILGVSFTNNPVTRNALINVVYRRYYWTSRTIGFTYIPCYYEFLNYRSQISADDEVHLTQAGQNTVADAAVQALLGGSASSALGVRYAFTGVLPGISFAAEQFLIVAFTPSQVSLDTAIDISSQWVKLGEITTNMINGSNDSLPNYFTLPCAIRHVVNGVTAWSTANLTCQFKHITENNTAVELWVRNISNFTDGALTTFSGVNAIIPSGAPIVLPASND